MTPQCAVNYLQTSDFVRELDSLGVRERLPLILNIPEVTSLVILFRIPTWSGAVDLSLLVFAVISPVSFIIIDVQLPLCALTVNIII